VARKIGEAFIRLKPDTKGFKEAAHQHVVQVGQELGTRFSEAFKESFRSIGAAVGAFLAGREIFGFLEDATAKAREAARLMRLTEAVIKSTGGTAGVSAKDIEELSYSLGEVAGVSADVVHGAENMLLSFTEVRNGVGKGNDIFNQASAAILDMSVFMNNGTTSMEALRATALQVGKALNNPTRGMTALSRAGVVFTEQQREQIKALQASGDLMGAQKIIIQELEHEFGGAAAAAADPAQRMAVAWSHFKKEVGEFILPVMMKLADVFTKNVMPAIRNHVIPAIAALRDWISDKIMPVIRDQLVPAIRDHLLPTLRNIGVWIRQHVTPLLAQLGEFITSKVIPALQEFGRWLHEHVLQALHNLGEFITTKVNPALLEFGRWLRVHVLQALHDLGAWIQTEGMPRLAGFQRFLKNDVVPVLVDIGAVVGWAILNVLIPALREVASIVGGALGWLTSASGAAEAARFAIGGAAAALLAYTIATKAIAVATAVWAAIQAVLDGALTANPIGIIVVAIGALVGAIIWVATKTTWFQTIWEHVWDFLKGIGHWFAHDFVDFFKNGWHLLEEAFKPENILAVFKRLINGIIGLWNRLDFGIHIHLPDWAGGFGFDIEDIFPDIPLLDRGGMVDRTGMAVVHRGELVGSIQAIADALIAALKGREDLRPAQTVFNLVGPSVPELAAQVNRELNWNKGA
jgi:hypothetical protein